MFKPTIDQQFVQWLLNSSRRSQKTTPTEQPATLKLKNYRPNRKLCLQKLGNLAMQKIWKTAPNKIKMRKAILLSIKEKTHADNLNLHSKDQIFHSIVKKLIIKPTSPPEKAPPITELQKHFHKQFYDTKHPKNHDTNSPCLPCPTISEREVTEAIATMPNKKSTGPDGIKIEEIKNKPPSSVAKLLNKLIYQH